MWDWDGLDLDTGSVAGSTGNAAPPLIGPPAILGHPAGMRPNTTAAVAPNNEHGGGFTGLLGGLFNNSRTGSQVRPDPPSIHLRHTPSRCYFLYPI